LTLRFTHSFCAPFDLNQHTLTLDALPVGFFDSIEFRRALFSHKYLGLLLLFIVVGFAQQLLPFAIIYTNTLIVASLCYLNGRLLVIGQTNVQIDLIFYCIFYCQVIVELLS
jgi:hypothetical protein